MVIALSPVHRVPMSVCSFSWGGRDFSGKHHPKRTAVGLINLVGFVVVVVVVVVAQTLDIDSYAPQKCPER